MKRTELQVIKDNVREMTDLLFDRDEIIFLNNREQIPVRPS